MFEAENFFDAKKFRKNEFQRVETPEELAKTTKISNGKKYKIYYVEK